MSKPITIDKRRAWRDLRGYAAPTGWMSDDDLERLARMVTLKEIKSAVQLANAAPDLLRACEAAMDSIARVRCNSEKCGGAPAYNRAVQAEDAICAAIARAKGA